ncbi:hypothetical protein AB0N06_04490 [Streptomyces sp. NPDC051020]|uniref:hypothetical protein n=1 Tax=Streptomyces sp. NPDC051020 TaxID=3155409 RepID=UPI00343669C4
MPHPTPCDAASGRRKRRRRNIRWNAAPPSSCAEELTQRNAAREHPVPPRVLAAQLHRFGPPYPGQAHRTWYIGASGTIEEEA